MSRQPVVAPARNAYHPIDAAERIGLDRERLLHAARFPKELLDDPDGLIDQALLKALWDEAARMASDPVFGLHAAERVRPAAFDVAGFAVGNCATGGEALERGLYYARRYFRLTEFDLRDEGDAMRLRYRFLRPDVTSDHVADFMLGTFLVGSRRFIGVDWVPQHVGVQRSAPEDASEHERVFGGPVRFEETWNTVVFDRALMDAPMLNADPDLLAVLEPHVDELIARIPRTPPVTVQVRHFLAGALGTEDVSLEATAAALGLPPRTLQRRLRDEGESHRGLLDAVREELARTKLREPGVPVHAVAGLLGFSDPTAFHRAFRRWTGTSPAVYRNRSRNG